MTETKAIDRPAHVACSEAVAPSAAVSDATLRITSDLIELRQERGDETAQIEAMAMHNAAISFLRPVLGPYGIKRMYELVLEDGEKIAARDRKSAEIGRKRDAKAAERRELP